MEQSEKLSSMVSLLRSYQKEVDRLTTRAKQGEEAFMEVFGVLSKVPSVEEAKQRWKEVISIASAAGRMEVQNEKLKKEIEGYKADFKEITSQELTLRKQEDVIAQYELDLKRLTSEGEEEAERKVESRYNEEMERKGEVIAQMRAETKNANESAAAALRERDIAQSHMMTLEARHSREMRAKQAEVDMLASEVESLNHTIAEQKTIILQSSSSSSPIHNQRIGNNDLSRGTPSKLGGQRFSENDLSSEIEIEKDIEIARLSSELKEANSTLQIMREEQSRESLEKEKTIERMESLLSSLPSPDQWLKVQHRLSVLEGLESFMGVGENQIEQGVDAILREKMRKTERLNLDLKTHIRSLEANLSHLSSSSKSLSLQIAEKDALIARMEDSISKSSLLSPSSSSDLPTPSTENLDSLVQVLKTQRDRYKARVEALESEKDKLTENARLAQVQADSLRQDNINLYQKVRYVQSYGMGSSSSSSSAKTQMGDKRSPPISSFNADIELGKSNNVEEKYRTMYEEQVNPFAAFNEREKTKRLEGLNPAERLILSSTSFFMASKNTRMLLFAYLVFLHLIVVFITYRGAVKQTDCLNKVADE